MQGLFVQGLSLPDGSGSQVWGKLLLLTILFVCCSCSHFGIFPLSFHQDMEKALDAMERYCNMYPALENTSELKFCRDLAMAFVNKKLEEFNAVLQKRNAISALVRFLGRTLLHIFPHCSFGRVPR